MRALVTGATGCVGANVVEALLEQGYTVRGLRRSTSVLDALDGLEVQLVVGDILVPQSLERAMAGCDLVFHVAAVSDYWRTPAETIYEVNVDGTRNVVQAALRAGVERLIYTSSTGALGVPPKGQLLDEEAVFNLSPRRFPYGHSKHVAEGVVRDAMARGLDAVIVNPAAAIGPRDIHWISGSLLREVRRGWARFAPPGGVCWVDAIDVGLGHVVAAERGRAGERYILGGDNLTHRRALEIVASAVGKRGPIATLHPLPMELIAAAVRWISRLSGSSLPFSAEQVWLSTREIYCDSSKAVEELGFVQTPFRTSVERAYSWYRARRMLD